MISDFIRRLPRPSGGFPSAGTGEQVTVWRPSWGFRIRKVVTPYAYLLPAFGIVAFVFAYPMYQLVFLSTEKVITYQNTVDVGFRNFDILFQDPPFRAALKMNLRLLLAVPALVVLSTIFAALLHDQVRGWQWYRAIVFLPYVISIPVIGVAFSYLLRLHGPVNEILEGIGLGVLAQDWLGRPQNAPWTLLGVIIWKELGFGIILFLARLLSARQELYEAAELDGANWWQRLWYISVPELRQVMGFYAVLIGITMTSWVFAYVITLTGGGPANSTTVIEFYIYRKAFGIGAGGRSIGVAAALSMLLLGVVVVFMMVQSTLHWLGSRQQRA